MTDLNAGRAPDLTNCDREPIHIPGAILPHGAMIVLDPDTFIVLQAAGETTELLGMSVETLIGRSAYDFWQPAQIEKLTSLAAAPALSQPSHYLDPLLRVSGKPLDASRRERPRR